MFGVIDVQLIEWPIDLLGVTIALELSQNLLSIPLTFHLQKNYNHTFFFYKSLSI